LFLGFEMRGRVLVVSLGDDLVLDYQEVIVLSFIGVDVGQVVGLFLFYPVLQLFNHILKLLFLVIVFFLHGV
jgi:hypothetical protein